MHSPAPDPVCAHKLASSRDRQSGRQVGAVGTRQAGRQAGQELGNSLVRSPAGRKSRGGEGAVGDGGAGAFWGRSPEPAGGSYNYVGPPMLGWGGDFWEGGRE
jgi:hypothetical protein